MGIVALTLVVVSATAGLVRASVITTGDVDPGGAGSQSDPWSVYGILRVGIYQYGTLNVAAGGLVYNTTGFIGALEFIPEVLGIPGSGGTGIATVTDANSLWDNSAELYVGYENSTTGTLNVTDGGVVTNTTGHIGYLSGSTGEVTVAGADSQWTNSSDLWVGRSGSGTLNIESAGAVFNSIGYIGLLSNSTGVATVTGADSQWTNSSDLWVGVSGSGTLNIENEGLVTVGGTTSIGAMGTVNLTGGRFEFGQTTLTEFSGINAASGSLAGNLNHAGYTNVATLTELQNPAVNLTDVTLTNSGVLYGDSSLGNALVNTADGEVETMAGERMRFGGEGNTNEGEINNFGGQIRFAQDMTNEADGFIGGEGQFVTDGGWTNRGLMAFSAPPTSWAMLISKPEAKSSR